MTRRTGRTADWSDWNANRPPVKNTPRRERQIREWEDQREWREQGREQVSGE